MSEKNGCCLNMVNSIWTPFSLFLVEGVAQNEAWQQEKQNPNSSLHTFFFFLQIDATPPRNSSIQFKKRYLSPGCKSSTFKRITNCIGDIWVASTLTWWATKRDKIASGVLFSSKNKMKCPFCPDWIPQLGISHRFMIIIHYKSLLLKCIFPALKLHSRLKSLKGPEKEKISHTQQIIQHV